MAPADPPSPRRAPSRVPSRARHSRVAVTVSLDNASISGSRTSRACLCFSESPVPASPGLLLSLLWHLPYLLW